MRYTRIWCYGGTKGKDGDDDFIVGMLSENGKEIKYNYILGNNSYKWYTVGERAFAKLSDAKAYIEKEA